jgi:hypothetical protein
MKMTIDGLTPRQVELLDIMWNVIDTEDEMSEWFETLDADEQREALVLQRLLMLETLDQELLKDPNFEHKGLQILVDMGLV